MAAPVTGPIVLAAGLVVERDGAILLVRRAKPPFQGQWSIPGGRVEPGERVEDAALRELHEESGTKAEIAGLIDVFETIGEHGHFVMIDYAARWISGEPRAGDDASEARFFAYSEALDAVGWDATRKAVAMARPLLARQKAAAKPR
ncbi:MAG: NUDIX hydrolase [Oceanicaulis sp.]